MWWQELEEHPGSDQVLFWEQIRQGGRFRYICRGIISSTFIGLVTWLCSRFLISWLFNRQINFTGGIELLPIFPVLAFIIFRERWSKNEKRYENATDRGNSK